MANHISHSLNPSSDTVMSYIILSDLPIEIQMMVFNHLYPDKQSLAHICLSGYNWSTIAQNSYSWQLLQQGFNSRKQPKLLLPELSEYEISTEIMKKPLFCVIFNDDVNDQRLSIFFRDYFMLTEERYRQKFCYEWLYAACFKGRLILVKSLYKLYNYTKKDINSNENTAFQLACLTGHLILARWLHSTFQLTSYDAWDNNNWVGEQSSQPLNVSPKAKHFGAFTKSCSNGYLTVAQWLYSTFHFTLADMEEDYILPFMLSCDNGHIATAQWLYSTFNISVADIKDSWTLQSACGGGHLFVVQWLHSICHFTTDDIMVGHNDAFKGACINGNLELAQWLYSTFQLTSIGRNSINIAFMHVCCRGYLLLAQWLHSTFKLNIDDVQSFDNRRICGPFRGSCEYGHLDVAKWLHNIFDLTDDDAQFHNNFALLQACKKGYLHVAIWLCDTFHIKVKEPDPTRFGLMVEDIIIIGFST